MDASLPDRVAEALASSASALVERDGGTLWLVAASPEAVHVHLAGTCAGCPGATMTEQHLLRPVVATAAPKATLRVTTGFRIPEAARRIAPRAA